MKQGKVPSHRPSGPTRLVAPSYGQASMLEHYAPEGSMNVPTPSYMSSFSSLQRSMMSESTRRGSQSPFIAAHRKGSTITPSNPLRTNVPSISTLQKASSEQEKDQAVKDRSLQILRQMQFMEDDGGDSSESKGWKQVTDQTGRVFFYHTLTGQISNQLPSGVVIKGKPTPVPVTNYSYLPERPASNFSGSTGLGYDSDSGSSAGGTKKYSYGGSRVNQGSLWDLSIQDPESAHVADAKRGHMRVMSALTPGVSKKIDGDSHVPTMPSAEPEEVILHSTTSSSSQGTASSTFVRGKMPEDISERIDEILHSSESESDVMKSDGVPRVSDGSAGKSSEDMHRQLHSTMLRQASMASQKEHDIIESQNRIARLQEILHSEDIVPEGGEPIPDATAPPGRMSSSYDLQRAVFNVATKRMKFFSQLITLVVNITEGVCTIAKGKKKESFDVLEVDCMEDLHTSESSLKMTKREYVAEKQRGSTIFEGKTHVSPLEIEDLNPKELVQKAIGLKVVFTIPGGVSIKEAVKYKVKEPMELYFQSPEMRAVFKQSILMSQRSLQDKKSKEALEEKRRIEQEQGTLSWEVCYLMIGEALPCYLKWQLPMAALDMGRMILETRQGKVIDELVLDDIKAISPGEILSTGLCAMHMKLKSGDKRCIVFDTEYQRTTFMMLVQDQKREARN